MDEPKSAIIKPKIWRNCMKSFIEKYGPWALVTGASSGIGEQFALQLAERGLHVVMAARRKERLDTLASQIREQHGVDTRTISVDLSHENFMASLLPEIEGLDVGLLVNNAGFATTGPFIDNDLEKEISQVHLNVRTVAVLSHIFGNKLAARGGGGIINMSSLTSFLPMPGWANYSASKVYVLNFTMSLWHELKPLGVDVLALCPGATRTEFQDVAGTKSTGMSPHKVARLALNTLGKKPKVVAGLPNKITSFLPRFFSKTMATRAGAMVVKALQK